MGKIIVFAIFGLIGIGALGWAITDRAPHIAAEHHQDTRFPTAVATPGKTRIESEMLAGWMLHSETSYLLIDTRNARSFSLLHLRRAINRQMEALLSLQSLRRLPRHKPIVLYGTNEKENEAAVEVLRMTGLAAFYLPGGNSWTTLPTVGSAADSSTALASNRQRHTSSVNNSPPASMAENGDTKADSPDSQLRLGMLND